MASSQVSEVLKRLRKENLKSSFVPNGSQGSAGSKRRQATGGPLPSTSRKSQEDIPVIDLEEETRGTQSSSKKRKRKPKIEREPVASSSSTVSQDDVIVIDLDNPNRHWKPPPENIPPSLLLEEMMKCQLCQRFFPRIQKAIECLDSHGAFSVLRCYLCFKVFVGNDRVSATRQLRDHYISCHNPNEREEMLCPYTSCNKLLDFQFATIHIIAYHGPTSHEQDVVARERNITRPSRIRYDSDGNPNGCLQNEVDIHPGYHRLAKLNPNRFSFNRCDCKYC